LKIPASVLVVVPASVFAGLGVGFVVGDVAHRRKAELPAKRHSKITDLLTMTMACWIFTPPPRRCPTATS
jgi:hypothetical protein